MAPKCERQIYSKKTEGNGGPEGSIPPPTLLSKLLEKPEKLYIAGRLHGEESLNQGFSFVLSQFAIG